MKSTSAEDRSPAASDTDWGVVSTKDVFVSKHFKLIEQCFGFTDQPSALQRRYVLERNDIVVVVPVTRGGDIVVLERFRHAARGRFLELPGTTVMGAEVTPAAAAYRCMRETVGYSATSVQYLGAQFPDPGCQTYRVHTYLAKGCEKRWTHRTDPIDAIELKVVSVDEALAWTTAGNRVHALMSASLLMALPKLNRLILE